MLPYRTSFQPLRVLVVLLCLCTASASQALAGGWKVAEMLPSDPPLPDSSRFSRPYGEVTGVAVNGFVVNLHLASGGLIEVVFPKVFDAGSYYSWSGGPSWFAEAAVSGNPAFELLFDPKNGTKTSRGYSVEIGSLRFRSPQRRVLGPAMMMAKLAGLHQQVSFVERRQAEQLEKALPDSSVALDSQAGEASVRLAR
jgi:hypothetical protein